MNARPLLLAVVAALVINACIDLEGSFEECRNGGWCAPGTTDAGDDAGTDAGTDAGDDAGTDAGTDAGSDAGDDGGASPPDDAGTPPVSLTLPTVNPSPRVAVGTPLIIDKGTWSPDAAVVSRAIEVCSPDGASCDTVGSTSYAPVPADLDRLVRVVEIATHDGFTASHRSEPSRVVRAGPAPLVYINGFEGGSPEAVTHGLDMASGIRIVGGGAERSGNWALALDAGASAPYFSADVADSAQLTVRLTVSLASLPATSASLVKLAYSGGGVALAVTASGAFTLDGVAAGVTATPGRRYVVELSAGATATQWRIDAQPQPPPATVPAGTTFTGVTLGSAAAAQLGAVFDDLAIATASGAYPIGDGYIFSVVPHQPASAPSGAYWAMFHDNADYLYEVAPGDDSGALLDDWPVITAQPDGYVSQEIAAAAPVSYGVQSFLAGDEVINAVRLAVAARVWSSGNSTPNVSFATGSGATVASLTLLLNSTSLQYSSKVATPTTPWSPTEIDRGTFRFGGATQTTPTPAFEALRLDLDFAL